MRSYIIKSLVVPLTTKTSIARPLPSTIFSKPPKRFKATMTSTSNQENLVNQNAEYAANFTEGDLPLAPAKK